MPLLDISDEQLVHLAKESVNKGYTVAGVQKKMSLHLSQEAEARLTIVNYPTGYILKPQTKDYAFLPEYEDLAMRLADISGIKTVPHALLKNENEYAYITKRIDRVISGENAALYAMEDFCQLSGRVTRDKYRGSYENCAKIIRKYSSRPGLDLSELFLRVVFSFVIGNSDMHLKNFSLREQTPAERVYYLAEAYDMLPVNLILPEDEEEMALTLNGKKRNIRRKDFLEFGNHCGLSEKTAVKLMQKICALQDKYEKACTQSFLQKKQIEAMLDLMSARIRRLGG
jgi:serine/threonine-protein kinase HipA